MANRPWTVARMYLDIWQTVYGEWRPVTGEELAAAKYLERYEEIPNDMIVSSAKIFLRDEWYKCNKHMMWSFVKGFNRWVEEPKKEPVKPADSRIVCSDCGTIHDRFKLCPKCHQEA